MSRTTPSYEPPHGKGGRRTAPGRRRASPSGKWQAATCPGPKLTSWWLLQRTSLLGPGAAGTEPATTGRVDGGGQLHRGRSRRPDFLDGPRCGSGSGTASRSAPCVVVSRVVCRPGRPVPARRACPGTSHRWCRPCSGRRPGRAKMQDARLRRRDGAAGLSSGSAPATGSTRRGRRPARRRRSASGSA